MEEDLGPHTGTWMRASERGGGSSAEQPQAEGLAQALFGVRPDLDIDVEAGNHTFGWGLSLKEILQIRASLGSRLQ